MAVVLLLGAREREWKRFGEGAITTPGRTREDGRWWEEVVGLSHDVDPFAGVLVEF